MAHIISTLISFVWHAVKDFLGVTKESSEWWKSMFERKILLGEVGFPMRWNKSTDCDVIWELETLINSLSHNNLSTSSNEQLHNILHAARSAPSLHQTNERTDHSDSYWAWSGASDWNANTSTSWSSKLHNEFDKREESDCALPSCNKDMAEKGDIQVMLDDSSPTWNHHIQFLDADDKSSLGPIYERLDDVDDERNFAHENVFWNEEINVVEGDLYNMEDSLQLKRCESCPNFLSCANFCEVHEYSVPKSFSLPSFHISDVRGEIKHCPEIYKTNSGVSTEDSNISVQMKSLRSCKIDSKSKITLLAEETKETAQVFEVVDTVMPTASRYENQITNVEMQSSQISKTIKTPTTIHEHIMKKSQHYLLPEHCNDQFMANLNDPKGLSRNRYTYDSTEYRRGDCQMRSFCQKQHVENNNFQVTKSMCDKVFTSQKGDPSKPTGGTCPESDFQDLEVNWNALVDSEENQSAHHPTKQAHGNTKPPKSRKAETKVDVPSLGRKIVFDLGNVDQGQRKAVTPEVVTPQSPLSASMDGSKKIGTKVRKKVSFSSSVDPRLSESEGGCPIKHCHIAGCLLSTMHKEKTEKKRSALVSDLGLSDFFFQITDKVKGYFLEDDSLPSTSKTLARVSNLGTELEVDSHGFSSGTKDEKGPDMTEYLRPLKADVSIHHRTEPPHPLEVIRQRLGLEKPKLPAVPKAPFHPSLSQRRKKESTFLTKRSFIRDTVAHIRNSVTKMVHWHTRLLRCITRSLEGPASPPTPDEIQSPPIGIASSDTESSQAKDRSPTRKQHFLTGLAAYKYYRLLTSIESKNRLKMLRAERSYWLEKYKWKQETLMAVVKMARDYYSNPTEVNIHRWKTLKQDLSSQHASDTDIRIQVSNLNEQVPYFTWAITVCQIMFLLVLFAKYGVDHIGVSTLKSAHLGLPTFLGSETITYLREPNPWIGPPADTLRVSGAMIPSCLRVDRQLIRWVEENNYKPMKEENRDYFGCCEVWGHFNRAGTTTLVECVELTAGLGHWTRGALCSGRSSTKNSIAHVIKPCCVGYHGKCRMLSHEHCLFIHGFYHVECDHCVQVGCIKDVCDVGQDSLAIQIDKDAPWQPSLRTAWQVWRFITAIPMTYGILHFLLLLPVHLMLMVPLEMCAGWYRVIIIYVCSSFAGQMIESGLKWTEPVVGSTGAAGGILGVAIVELFQAWRFLHNPRWELLKLLSMVLLFIFLGTLPLLSITNFLGGLYTGMLCSLIILPYITFGRRLGLHRAPLVIVGLALLVPSLFIMRAIFRSEVLDDLCPSCSVLECIPYTDRMCQSHGYTYT